MIRCVNGRWGVCWYFGKDEYVGRSVHHYGEYNPDECEFMVDLAYEAEEDKQQDILVLDIGANIGCISQALEYNGYRVVAFEPQPEVFNLLRKNIAGEAYNIALGREEGEGKMPKIRYDDKNNVGSMSIGASSVLGTITVPIKTIDSFNFEDVGVMKIDVEGFEEEVLRGAVDTINRCKPILYIEDDRVTKSASLHAFLKELGYEWEEHLPPLYRKDNYFGLEKNIWGKNYVSKNLVCRYAKH